MTQALARISERVEPLVERIGGRQRAVALAGGIGAVLLILGISWWATTPGWTPVLSGIPLENVGRVTDRLDEAGIRYRLAGGGAELRVRTTDLARTRVLLAGEGLPSPGRPGLELFDQPSWGMTDFTQRVNYRRALEGELERTIGQMHGVESAKVHLSMHERASFRRADTEHKASVVLNLAGGGKPTTETVQGIAQLTASSVDGLKSDDVSVLDGSGRLLSAAVENGALDGATQRQLALQREVERYLEDKVEELLLPVLGGGNSRARISALVNFDKVDRTIQTYDPERQVASSERRAEIIPGDEGGAASVEATTNYENSRTYETVSGAIGGIERLTVAVLVNDVEEGGMPQEQLGRIETLVRSAVGLNDERGDLVSVVAAPFAERPESPPGGETPTDIWTIIQQLQQPVTVLIALVFAFILGLRLVRSLRTVSGSESALKSRDERDALPSGEDAVRDEAEAQPPEPLAAQWPEPVDNPIRRQAAASVERQPEVAARIARSWMNHD